ncbi:MAG TPA: RHS repeat-associated core domain-containing protein, partial [Acidimicrobiales bacterium]|nr:RHS repeat-associated core domain-containing protein [Acidimicrobiales bacterium]
VQSGNIVGTQSYSPYGSLASSTGTDPTPFGFAGGYADATGLIYLINRYYDPATGQFLSVDLMLSDTKQPYSYAQDDPINLRDPRGTDALPGSLPGSNCTPLGSAVLCVEYNGAGSTRAYVDGTFVDSFVFLIFRGFPCNQEIPLVLASVQGAPSDRTGVETVSTGWVHYWHHGTYCALTSTTFLRGIAGFPNSGQAVNGYPELPPQDSPGSGSYIQHASACIQE